MEEDRDVDWDRRIAAASPVEAAEEMHDGYLGCDCWGVAAVVDEKTAAAVAGTAVQPGAGMSSEVLVVVQVRFGEHTAADRHRPEADTDYTLVAEVAGEVVVQLAAAAENVAAAAFAAAVVANSYFAGRHSHNLRIRQIAQALAELPQAERLALRTTAEYKCQ